MKAIRCDGSGGPDAIRVEDVEAPRPRSEEVLVQIVAAGVSFPDLLISKGKYQIKPDPPFTLGGEFAGLVIDVGAEVDDLIAGDRVAGFTTTGAFAEIIAVPRRRLHHIREDVSYDVAAGFSLNYSTAYAALKTKAKLSEGETLLVLGAGGGIGLAAVELGKHMNARVLACASSEKKLDVCRQYGAEATINYSEKDLRQEIRKVASSRGIDVIIDPVGGALTEAAFREIGYNGRLVAVGFASGEIPRLPLNLPLLKGASVLGFSIGALLTAEPETAAENWRELETFLSAGRLRPHISARFPLADAPRALKQLESRRAVGKLILEIGS